MVCSQGTGKCRRGRRPDAAGNGLLFSASFPTGRSRRACSPAPKACALGPRVRGAVLTATCSWPWSCLPKSWRSGSSGSGRRRRSSSKSYSCLSRRNRPFRSRAARSRASGLHAGASLVPRGRGAAPRVEAADRSCPLFPQRCQTRDSQAHPRHSPGEGLGTGRPHLQAKGRRASSLAISCIGWQVMFLLPALDKNPNPRKFVDEFLSRSDNQTSYCRVRVLLYTGAAAFLERGL